MYRSLPRTLPLVALLSFVVAGCSMFGHEEKPPPPVILHTATMDLTPGIVVNALFETPPGFTPIVSQPPLWLQGGKELALAGTLHGRTEVLGFNGKVEVHSLLDPTGPGVIVTANEATTVEKGRLPTTPRRYSDTLFRQQLEGFSFIGGGRFESVTAGHPLLSGSTVPRPDRAPAVLPSTVASGGVHDASTLIGQSPPVLKAVTGQLGISF